MAQILLCTVGTSLLQPNLRSLADRLQRGTLDETLRPLAEAFVARDWPQVAARLAALDPHDRTCGAEINSVACLVHQRDAPAGAGVYLFHSATPDGRDIAAVLAEYFRLRGHAPVTAWEIADLQDEEPRRFRTHGLRNLVRALCRAVRDHTPAACAFNATGGYKAQIAVAVLLGQALHMPVYYKHERFDAIIAFPPLPVALDLEVWMRASGILQAVGQDMAPAGEFEEEWDEAFECLFERERIDGAEWLTISATGQILEETFRDRFRSERDQYLPPPAPPGKKLEPVLKSDEGHMLALPEVQPFLVAVTREVPQVTRCITTYYNPNLPQRTRFVQTRDIVQGILSRGSWTVKFRVETTASTAGQRAAVVAALNEWLASR